MSERGEENQSASGRSSGPDWLEQAATWVSGVLVLAVIVVLLWDAVHADRPPALEASSGSPKAVGGRWHVPIIVRNAGDVAVQEIAVSVSLEHPDTTVKNLQIRIDWLPGRSEREVDAIFAVDPSRGRVTTEVESFEEP